MLQLIYLSEATVPLSEEDRVGLCAQASRNNARDEITGVLLIEGSHFLQVLEGPRETVENAFLRIIVDPRHHRLLLLSRRLRTKREFGKWSMALCDEPGDKEDVVGKVRPILQAAPSHLRLAFDRIFPPGACGPADARTNAVPVTGSGTAPPA